MISLERSDKRYQHTDDGTASVEGGDLDAQLSVAVVKCCLLQNLFFPTQTKPLNSGTSSPNTTLSTTLSAFVDILGPHTHEFVNLDTRTLIQGMMYSQV